MTTEQNQIFIAVAGDELSSTIYHVYILRGRRGPIMFGHLTLNFAGKLERFWN